MTKRKQNIIKHKKIIFIYKNGQRNFCVWWYWNFKKINFTAKKSPIVLKDVDVKKVLVSNKISSGEKNYKYFIGFKVKLLRIMLAKTSAYRKSYDGQTKWMYFLIEDDDWRGCTDIIIEVNFFLKTKIKSHGDEVTDFYYKEIAKADSNHTWLAVISLDSTLNKDGNYYSQVFLKECKYIKKNLVKHIIEG